jgi:hypothetical protein
MKVTLRGTALFVFPLVIVAGVLLYFFGPAVYTESFCLMCGKGRATGVMAGLRWHEKEYETDESLWYQRMGLKAHEHHWIDDTVTLRRWGGQRDHFDGFGWPVYALYALMKASNTVDATTLAALVQEYYALRRDQMLLVPASTRTDPNSGQLMLPDAERRLNDFYRIQRGFLKKLDKYVAPPK